MKATAMGLLALASVLFAGSLSAVAVGEMGPDFKFDKSWNTIEGATKLSDYRGKVVLIEAWATWWGPCMAGVPHLIELNNKYREGGFEILAVSKEDAATIESKLIKAKSPTYGVVKADIGSLYTTNGIPHGWVLDAEGKCIWEGHPSGIKNETIEEWIKDLAPGKITKEVSKPLKSAVEAYNKGQFGKAYEAVAEHLTAEDEKVKADAEYVNGVIEKRKAAGEAKAKKLREAGNLIKLVPVLEEEAKGWEGSEYGKACGDEAKTAKASKEYKLCVKAADAWAKLEPKLNDLADDKAAKALEKFIKDYAGTPQAKLAEDRLKDVK